MGHYLDYILSGTEEDVLELLDSNIGKVYLSVEKKDQNGLMEGKFEFCFTCVGEVIRISYPQIKYSWIIEGNSIENIIEFFKKEDSLHWKKLN